VAEKFDVPARLAEGRPAVDNVQQYVWACHLLGYQNSDLTLHAAQIRDWYDSEDGLDLRALDADCIALEAAVAATERALQMQDDQLAALPTAWHGRGADASREFLRRHGIASEQVAGAVRTAADTLAALRENLWHMVDGKVAAAQAIDDRRVAERADWLAAAQTVTTGVGDRAVASELIDQQVKPFVDNDIRSDWLTAMRTTIASIGASYYAATVGLSAEPPAVFEVPGDLGPAWVPSPDDPAEEPDRPVIGAGATTAPAGLPAVGWGAPAPSMPAATLAAPPPAPPVPPVAPVAAPPVPPAAPVEPAAAPPAMPSMPTLPSMGGGLPGVGSGLSGLGQQLADMLSGLLPSSDNPLPDPPEPDTAQLDEPVEPDEPTPPEEATEDAGAEDESTKAEDEAAADDATLATDPGQPEEPAAEPVACNEEEPAGQPPPEEPAPTSAPIPPPPEPVSPPSASAPTATPCEIAADELPQAGQ
jgi:hypothetical protein